MCLGALFFVGGGPRRCAVGLEFVWGAGCFEGLEWC